MSTLATMVALLTLLGMPTAALPQSILGVAFVIDGILSKFRSPTAGRSRVENTRGTTSPTRSEHTAQG
jgi:hypothetical protein